MYLIGLEEELLVQVDGLLVWYRQKGFGGSKLDQGQRMGSPFFSTAILSMYRETAQIMGIS